MRRTTAEVESTILRHLLVDKWPVGTIASTLGIHHGVVRRVLAQHGVPMPTCKRRSRMIDPYVDFIEDTLMKYPRLHASRLHQRVQARGYTGVESHFRRLVAELRPRKTPEPFLRLRKLPGEEAQVDWASFGSVTVGRAVRRLSAFVMTLSWSRMIWLEFFYDMKMANFLRGHVDALRFFGGVPRKLIYDNLKSAVIDRGGTKIHYNPQLLELANEYRFEPRAAAPRRGNEKGVVERSIRYVRTSFFAARRFTDIEQLNNEAKQWCLGIAAERTWQEDDARHVKEVFAEEQSKLMPLPDDDFPAYERKSVKVGRTPWVRFDKNDYSVPAKHVRSAVEVLADFQRVRIVADGEVVADHPRSFDRRASIEDPAHTAEILAYKRHARQGKAGNRLFAAATAAETFVARAAERGHNLGGTTSGLLLLLDIHGAVELQAALSDVNARNVVNVKSVQLVLEQRARARGRSVPLPVKLPRAELELLTVRAPDLSGYDNLADDGQERNEVDDV